MVEQRMLCHTAENAVEPGTHLPARGAFRAVAFLNYRIERCPLLKKPVSRKTFVRTNENDKATREL